ncbi:hypothetical protein ACJX0J_027837 [Zea mays]
MLTMSSNLKVKTGTLDGMSFNLKLVGFPTGEDMEIIVQVLINKFYPWPFYLDWRETNIFVIIWFHLMNLSFVQQFLHQVLISFSTTQPYTSDFCLHIVSKMGKERPKKLSVTCCLQARLVRSLWLLQGTCKDLSEKHASLL